jgi:hypothetical protein
VLSRELETGAAALILHAAVGADVEPQERDDDGQKPSPDVDDGGRLAALAHEALEERVQMEQHSHAEEHAAQQFAGEWPDMGTTFTHLT